MKIPLIKLRVEKLGPVYRVDYKMTREQINLLIKKNEYSKLPFAVNIDTYFLEIIKRDSKCRYCGIKPDTFYFESQYKKGPFLLHAYSVKNDKEILMTKDHIIPRSLSGPNFNYNLQTLCVRCNSKKGNSVKIRDLITFTCNYVLYNFQLFFNSFNEMNRIYFTCLHKSLKRIFSFI